MKKFCRSRNLGQTLAEIVVVIAVVLLLVTGLVVGATGSLKAAAYGRAKSQAVGYAQEALELARSLRDQSWTNFLSYGTTTGQLWCLDQTNTWTPATGGVCPTNINGVYTRGVTFTWNDPQMRVDVSVSWTGGDKTYNVALSTYLTQWR